MGEDKINFKEMSLGDHLEELRIRLILAITGLGAGLIICLFFGGFFMRLIASPYSTAMNLEADKAVAAAIEQNTGEPEAEIRQRFTPGLQAINPPEKFLVYLKTSLLFGLIISSPWVFYHLWAFISAGLYAHEKRYVRLIVPISTILFVVGSLFFIKVIAPLAMLFFVKFDTGIEFVKSDFSLQNYVNLIITLTVVFGLAFQMPIFIVAIEKMGLVGIDKLTAVRKYVILALVAIAAIVTPPDVISQISLAIPLYFLYEASILFCRLTKKSEN